MGALTGRVASRRKPAADRRLRDNLRRLRPDLTDPRDLDLMARRVWENCGRSLAEFAVLNQILGTDRVKVDGIERLLDAWKSGRPRIFMLLHLGNWELVGPTLVELGERSGFQIVQPPLDPVRRRLAEKARLPYADQTIEPGPGTAARIVRCLKAGGCLVIAADEYIHGRVKGPAFTRPLDMTGNLRRIARLAAWTDAIVFIACVERHRGARFTIHILPLAPINHGAKGEADLARVTAELNAAVEAVVLKHLEQWFWLDNLTLDDPPGSSRGS